MWQVRGGGDGGGGGDRGAFSLGGAAGSGLCPPSPIELLPFGGFPHSPPGLCPPFLLCAGAEISFGDAALFPTFVFFVDILPRHFGWPGVFSGRPRLEAWWAAVQGDPAVARVIGEMRGGLADWENAKRWDSMGISAQVADGSFNWSCA